MDEVWIIDAVRTPRAIGKPGKGAYWGLHPQRLLSAALQELKSRHGLDTADVDDVIAGCTYQAGRQGACIARMALLDAGWDVRAPGVTLDRFCGSALTAVNMAAAGIMSGMQQLVVAGGVESMSYMTASMSADLADQLVDRGNLHLRARHPQAHQGVCADLIATLEGVSREEVDDYAVESQRRAHHAMQNGYFSKSYATVRDDEGAVLLEQEQYPRPGATRGSLSQLSPAFAALYEVPLDAEGLTHKQLVQSAFPGVEINHVHHAGNSSGVVDGAAAVLLASPAYARMHGMKPRARIRAFATAGDQPALVLDAPAPATRKALKLAGLGPQDIDLFEVNEAFAVVPIKYIRDLNLDPATVNVNGGAIALGHPLGATGAMLLGTVLDELERRDLNTGLITLCAAGGMAPATIIERI